MQIFTLEKQRKRIKAKIAELYPIRARISTDGQIVTLVAVQERLPENELVYEYLQTDKDLYILRIQQNSATLYRRDEADFASDLDLLLSNISSEKIAINSSNSRTVCDKFNKHAYRLFQNLLPDYQAKNLLIVPDGKLNYLPFELLLKKPASGEQINYGLLPYILKSGSVKYAFSSSLHFASIDTPKKRQSQLLAIVPSYPSTPSGFLASRIGFSSLQHTAKEAESISELMNGDHLIGPDATVGEFKISASGYKVLHLAMHAFTHDKDPMLSGMDFSETDTDNDNILHAYELYNMDIPSDLVVLSACNTGLGQLLEGEGVMSLGRAFRHAGTENVVMGLWQANDESTSQIMKSSYENIEGGASTQSTL